MIDEKGIDPSRIELRTGDAHGRAVDTHLVPAGATFDFGSTATFDGRSISRHGQPYSRTPNGQPAKKIRATAN